MKKLVISVGSTDEKRVVKTYEVLKAESCFFGNPKKVYYVLFENHETPVIYDSLEELFTVLSKCITFDC